MSDFILHNGDCVDIVPTFDPQSVDAIITDLPYGTTACKWDTIIPFEPMWKEVKRVLKPNGVFITTSTQPFTSALVMSNPSFFKYEWIWHKSKCGSSFTSKYRPQQKHENVLVFGKGKSVYNPQMLEGSPYYRKRKKNNGDRPNNHSLGVISDSETLNTGYRYPETVQYFQQKWRRQDQIHPTQKPVALYEYLIKTYTNEGETVLDIAMGSGTTGVACMNVGRNFIGIEKELEYYKIAKKRIEQAQSVHQPALQMVGE